ncbi:MAG: hypothetical protein ABIE74_11885, partial [Pseudomonadota bacterium]
MSNIGLGEVTANIPSEWSVEGMLTITLPSDDKNVKPNVILTKEFLPQPVDLNTYFGHIRKSIESRGIKDLQISEEKDIAISGVRGKMMLCSWDVSSMAEMMKKENPNQKIPEIEPGKMVKQVQVTLLKDRLAINMTASFPEKQFKEYYKPFQDFLKTFKIA